MNRLLCFGFGTVLLLQFNFSRFWHTYNKTLLDFNPKLTNASFCKDSNRCFIIAGSFLIPQNADNQLKMIKNKGFNKAFKYNFPQSEYYSVVVDTFNAGDTSQIVLTDELLRLKQPYFIKCL
ncbi:MAG: hypothetical protein IPK91_01960 [Saprospiraceae bacterium]|jgi:hypothetical protein|nr:hypothetical protein [Saprospiraceae bacterium]MBK8296057.1 hypothetical protein [Saprospiraceae bacterium]